jgi:hypothetical protein
MVVSELSRLEPWRLYKNSATMSCPSNKVEFFESNCVTPLSDAYVTSGNGPGPDIWI